MKKLLCTLLALAVVLSVLPACAFAKSYTVTLYGNRFSEHAKQVCFVAGDKDDYELGILVQAMAKFYEPNAPKYYYVGDAVIDFKLVAEKLPELQSVSVVMCDVKNTASLADMKNLVWLGLYDNTGAEGLGFLKNMTGLKKFRYVNGNCKSINPVSFLKNLTELYLGGCKVTDMKPLKGLTKLKDLRLDYYMLEDLSGLSKMKDLRRLYIGGSKLADVSALKKLTKLRQLSLGDLDAISAKKLCELTRLTSLELINCSVSDFDSLADMKNLKEFSLTAYHINNTMTSTIAKMTQLETLELMEIGKGGITDCEFLKNHKKLKKLVFYDIFGSGTIDISALKGLTELEYLDFGGGGVKIKDISALKNLKKLSFLDINNSEVTDLSPLSGLTELTELNLAGTSPESFAPILKLKKLKVLNIFGTGISDADIAKIKKNIPGCKIYDGYFTDPL